MTLKVYNTQKRQKETFEPGDPERVTMYVCGPTVYNLIHIGNARPIVVFDTFYRVLQQIYPNVIYARNITDVDDKINAAARENDEPIKALTDRFTEALHDDIAKLNVLPPSIEPRATDHMQEMIELSTKLIEREHAYVADGHVLFAVESMAEYGQLSNRKLEDMEMGARVEVADYKRHPGDFVLWKPSDDDTPGWDSPWGYGRPGWHLECSAMIEAHLGKTIDVHGGGQDLVFPHHENERAQSCCANEGEQFVKYWMHNAFITMTGDKMSKSEGNFFTLRDVLGMAPGEAVRMFLLSGHYRSGLDWSKDNLQQARSSLDGLYTALRSVAGVEIDEAVTVDSKVMAALEDDLNTPLAISELHEIARQLNKATSSSEKIDLKSRLLSSASIMGLLQQEPEAWFRWQGEVDDDALSDADVDDLIAKRNAARSDKDFATADQIRDELDAAGIILEDGAGGTQWKRS